MAATSGVPAGLCAPLTAPFFDAPEVAREDATSGVKSSSGSFLVTLAILTRVFGSLCA